MGGSERERVRSREGERLGRVERTGPLLVGSLALFRTLRGWLVSHCGLRGERNAAGTGRSQY